MENYVKEAYKNLEEKELRAYTYKEVAEELRRMLGDKEIINIYESLLENRNIRYNNLNECLYGNTLVDEEKDYNYFWIAAKLIEMDNNGESEDGFKYPSHGWIDGLLCDELFSINNELNRLKGVHCENECIYKNGSCYNTKGFWAIDFDTIEDFNHFLWAACFRYIPLSKNTDWLLLPNLGDPNYNEKRIRMELHYNKLNAKKDEILKDVKHFAKCIKKYVEGEEEVRNNYEDICLVK